MLLTAVIIFGFTYLTISVQRLPYFHLDRTSGALIGAVAMVAFGVLTINQAYQSLNLDTIVLLLGMMIVVAYLQISGFFELVAAFILKRARTGNGLLLTIIISSGILSAFCVNDTICVMMTPFVLLLTSRSQVEREALFDRACNERKYRERRDSRRESAEHAHRDVFALAIFEFLLRNASDSGCRTRGGFFPFENVF